MTQSVIVSWNNSGIPRSGVAMDPATQEPIHDWSSLTEGERVTVELPSGPLSGRVDSLSVDAVFLWVLLDHGQGRRLFLHSEVDRLWRLSA